MDSNCFFLGFMCGVIFMFGMMFCIGLTCNDRAGYAKAIEDIKSYGAEKVVARFDKDNGK